MRSLHDRAALLASLADAAWPCGQQEDNMDLKLDDYFAGLPRQDPKNPRRQPRKLIGVRLSDAERGTIIRRAAAAGLPISAYVRQAALGGQVRAVVPTVNRGAWAELARTAANVNQLTRQANEGRILLGAALRPLLEQLRREIADLRLLMVGEAANQDEAA